MSYDASNGADFKISTNTGAPTISSEQYIMFGNVSVYAKASPGTGIVSSFILESDDLDEIDWEWLGSNDTSVESNFFGKGNVTTYDRAIYHTIPNAVTGWHTYTIQWTKDYVKWFVDDLTTPVRILAFDDPKTIQGTQFPQTPMKIKLGNWVGCADAAAASDPKTQGTCQWAGGPVSFPNGATYSMYVKNITINDAGCGGTYTYSDKSGTYGSIKSSNEGASCGASSSPSSAAGSSSGTASATSGSATGSASGASNGSAIAPGGPLAHTASGGPVASASANANATGTGSGRNGTTLATASPTTGSSSGATSKAGGASSTASGGQTQVTANAANVMKPSHKYGSLDAAVMVLGLGLGYLVM
jgi:beta-glucanase (GH16 family)